MQGRVLSRPVCGFSSAQKRGRRSRMISSALMARRSPSSSFRGRRVMALLYSVQTGEAQIMSKCAGAKSGRGSQLQMSAQTVGSDFGSTSSEVTSQPSSRKALPTEPVPEKNSSSRLGISQLRPAEQPHYRKPGEQEAGVAAERLAPVQRRLPVQL